MEKIMLEMDKGTLETLSYAVNNLRGDIEYERLAMVDSVADSMLVELDKLDCLIVDAYEVLRNA